METLNLGIFADLSQQEVRDRIISEFQIDDPKLIDKYDVLVAYVDYGSYEGTGWILLRDMETGELYENHSSHCSCYGNEGQFHPEPCALQYLKSDKFSIYSYGEEDRLIRQYISNLQ